MGTKNLFVDCGFHQGRAIAHFTRELDLRREGWEVFAFEPNPACHGYFPRWAEVGWRFLPFAVWTTDARANFQQENWQISKSDTPIREVAITHDGQYSTMVGTNRAGLCDPITVPTIDFAKFLKRFANYDRVVVKMSIEGAEFPVLRHLLETKTLGIIDELHLDMNEQVLPRESRISAESLVLACEEHTRVFGTKTNPTKKTAA